MAVEQQREKIPFDFTVPGDPVSNIFSGAPSLPLEKIQERETRSVGLPKIGGPFSLVDENGKRRTDQDFLGKFTMVYFGFTYCPDICPIELSKMADALTQIEKLPQGNEIVAQIQPLFISVDPKRDTLEQIKKYTKGGPSLSLVLLQIASILIIHYLGRISSQAAWIDGE